MKRQESLLASKNKISLFSSRLFYLFPPCSPSISSPKLTCRSEQSLNGKTLTPFHHFSLHLTHNKTPESLMCKHACVVCMFKSFKCLFSSADLRYLQPAKLYMNCDLNNECRAFVFANICPLDVTIFVCNC